MTVRARKLHYNAHGEPTFVIEATGVHDVYRLAHHLRTGQVEFSQIGYDAERKLRRRIGRAGWQWLMRYMHGDGGFR